MPSVRTEVARSANSQNSSQTQIVYRCSVMASEAAAQLQQKQGVHNLHMVKAYSDEPDNPSEATSEVWKLYSGEITKPVAVVKVASEVSTNIKLRQLKCPGILKSVLTAQGRNLSTFLARYGGENLHTAMLRMSDSERQEFFPHITASVFVTLVELHKLEIIHKDLKLQDICFDEDTMMVSLIDLGCATEFKYPASIGTQGYMPPECYQPLQLADGTCVYAMFEPGQKWVSQWYTGTYDVWAAAWTMLHFWVKGLPETYMNGGYEEKSQFTPELLEAFLRAYVPDDSMRDFFMVTLDLNPATRWTAEQVLSHPYLEEHVQKVHNYWNMYQPHADLADDAAEEAGQRYLALRMQGVDLPILESDPTSPTPEGPSGASYASTASTSYTMSSGAFTKTSTQQDLQEPQQPPAQQAEPKEPTAALHQLPFLGHLTYALHRQAGGYYSHHHRCQGEPTASPTCTGLIGTSTNASTADLEQADEPCSSLPPVRTSVGHTAGRSGSSTDVGPSTPPLASGEHPAASLAHPTQHHKQPGQPGAAPHPTRHFVGGRVGRVLRKGATKVARAAVRALPVMALGLLLSRRGRAS